MIREWYRTVCSRICVDAVFVVLFFRLRGSTGSRRVAGSHFLYICLSRCVVHVCLSIQPGVFSHGISLVLVRCGPRKACSDERLAYPFKLGFSPHVVRCMLRLASLFVLVCAYIGRCREKRENASFSLCTYVRFCFLLKRAKPPPRS